MSIELTDKTIGIWYIAIENQDWLAHIAEEEEYYQLDYRHRYYVDDNAFDSEDVKNWYSVKMLKANISLQEVLTLMDRFTTEGSEQFDGIYHKLIKDSGESLDDFMKRFQKLPFVHRKTVSKEEADKMDMKSGITKMSVH